MITLHFQFTVKQFLFLFFALFYNASALPASGSVRPVFAESSWLDSFRPTQWRQSRKWAKLYRAEDVKPFSTFKIKGLKLYITQRILTSNSNTRVFVAKARQETGENVIIKMFSKSNKDYQQVYIAEKEALHKLGRLVSFDDNLRVIVQKVVPGFSLEKILTHASDPELAFRKIQQKYLDLGDEFHRKTGLLHGAINPEHVIVDPQTLELNLVSFGNLKSADGQSATSLLKQQRERSQREMDLLFERIHRQRREILGSPESIQMPMTVRIGQHRYEIVQVRGLDGSKGQVWYRGVQLDDETGQVASPELFSILKETRPLESQIKKSNLYVMKKVVDDDLRDDVFVIRRLKGLPMDKAIKFLASMDSTATQKYKDSYANLLKRLLKDYSLLPEKWDFKSVTVNKDTMETDWTDWTALKSFSASSKSEGEAHLKKLMYEANRDFNFLILEGQLAYAHKARFGLL